jgi:hypothetical protein
MERQWWQQAMAALAAGGARRAGVCGGDCGNNDSSYVKAVRAAAAVSQPGCGCSVGRQR